MIEGLDQLCKAIGIVDHSTARQVVEEVNRKLSSLVKAQVVKFYWSKEAEDGIALEPIAFINTTRNPDPQQFTVTETSTGVLHWVFRNKRPVWFENVRRTRGDDTLTNLIDSSEIAASEMAIGPTYDIDSLIVIPILERGVPQGVYSVELQSSGRLTRGIVALMNELGGSVGTLVYNADMYEYDTRKTREAVRKFFDAIQDVALDPVVIDQKVRTAFVARPYGGDFTSLQEHVERALAAKGVRARHYTAEMSRAVIDEIVAQIRNSHFCVVDLTGNNPNVLTEVGMMIVLGKRLVVLRRRGDETALPFDVSHYSYWEYELPASDDEAPGADDLQVWSPADNRLMRFDEVLHPFLDKLPPASGFWSAERWDPGNGHQDP